MRRELGQRMAAAAMALAAAAAGAAPPEARTVDVAALADGATAAPSLSAFQAGERTWRWTLLNGGTPLDGSGYGSGYMWWASNNTASAVVTAACSWVSQTGGVFDATFAAADLNHVGGNYPYGVGLVTTGATAVPLFGGVLRILPDPYAVGATAITYTAASNLAVYAGGTNYAGPDLALAVDVADGVAPPIAAFRGGARSHLVTLLNGGAPYAGGTGGVSPQLYWYASPSADGVVPALCEWTATNAFRARWRGQDLNHTGGGYWYGMALVSNEEPAVLMHGAMTIIPDPYATGANLATLGTNINAALYNWTNVPAAWTQDLYSVVAAGTGGISVTTSAVGNATTYTVSDDDTGVGGGETNHPDLYNLGWTVGGHTGTADTVACFAGDGSASTLPTSTWWTVGAALTNATDEQGRDWFASLSNEFLAATNLLTTGKVDRAGDTMSGALTINENLYAYGSNIYLGVRSGEGATLTNSIVFGYWAGMAAVGKHIYCVGDFAGQGASGDYAYHLGIGAGAAATGRRAHNFGAGAGGLASGEYQHNFGYSAGASSTGRFAHSFGQYAGMYSTADPSNQLYMGMYPVEPAAGHDPTNDQVWIDGLQNRTHVGSPTGTLYLRGPLGAAVDGGANLVTNFSDGGYTGTLATVERVAAVELVATNTEAEQVLHGVATLLADDIHGWADASNALRGEVTAEIGASNFMTRIVDAADYSEGGGLTSNLFLWCADGSTWSPAPVGAYVNAKGESVVYGTEAPGLMLQGALGLGDAANLFLAPTGTILQSDSFVRLEIDEAHRLDLTSAGLAATDLPLSGVTIARASITDNWTFVETTNAPGVLTTNGNEIGVGTNTSGIEGGGEVTLTYGGTGTAGIATNGANDYTLTFTAPGAGGSATRTNWIDALAIGIGAETNYPTYSVRTNAAGAMPVLGWDKTVDNAWAGPIIITPGAAAITSYWHGYHSGTGTTYVVLRWRDSLNAWSTPYTSPVLTASGTLTNLDAHAVAVTQAWTVGTPIEMELLTLTNGTSSGYHYLRLWGWTP